jgi:integrase
MSVKVRKFRRGGYEVDIIVRLPDGTRLRERKKTPCTSKSAAQRWGEERQAILLLHGKPRRKEVPTLEAFTPRYMAEHVKANRHKPSTQSLKEHIIDFYLKPRWAKRRLDDIHDADVQKLKAELADLSPKTVNNVLCVLNTMLKVALEWDVLEAMPARVKLLKVSPSEVPFYEPHEYERLVEAARSIGDQRLLVFVLLGGDAGLRCGEIIALEQTDVDLKRGVLHVRQSEWEGHVTLPKSGRGRKVVLTERLAAALARNRHLRGPRVLWREESEGKVTQVLLAKWMRRLQRRAGLKETGQLHILRHTFCSRLAMAGASTMAIKELAGHQQISTTQRYMHLSPAAKSAAIRLLDRGADRVAEELKDTENRGDTVETVSPSPQIPSNSM